MCGTISFRRADALSFVQGNFDSHPDSKVHVAVLQAICGGLFEESAAQLRVPCGLEALTEADNSGSTHALYMSKRQLCGSAVHGLVAQQVRGWSHWSDLAATCIRSMQGLGQGKQSQGTLIGSIIPLGVFMEDLRLSVLLSAWLKTHSIPFFPAVRQLTGSARMVRFEWSSHMSDF